MKNLLELGKTLSKVEQKQVFGGNGPNRLMKKPDDDSCGSHSECSGALINGEWHEGLCQITAGGLGVCVIQTL